jgi:aspartate aminotransferase, cytoplasmic
LAGLLLARSREVKPKIYVPEPTWSNHIQVFTTLGFQCVSFRYYDTESRSLDYDSYLSTLRGAEPGSAVVLHACAHNPTGCDPSKDQWHQIGDTIKERQLFPIFDSAYLGFNSGNFDNDAFPIRHFVHDLNMEAIVCVSFAKNMGLYGECLALYPFRFEVRF